MSVQREIYGRTYDFKLKMRPGGPGERENSPEDTILEDLDEKCIRLGQKERDKGEFLWYDDIESIYLHDDLLFICDIAGVWIYNNSNPEALEPIVQYNISDAQSIFCLGTTIYLATKTAFYVLDITNLSNIQILDEYILGPYEGLEFKFVHVTNNLAILLAGLFVSYDYSDRPEEPLYIFDVTNPTKIVRIYPEKLWKPILIDYKILLYITIPIIGIGLIIISVVLIRKYKKPSQK